MTAKSKFCLFLSETKINIPAEEGVGTHPHGSSLAEVMGPGCLSRLTETGWRRMQKGRTWFFTSMKSRHGCLETLHLTPST